jgi:putative transposase
LFAVRHPFELEGLQSQHSPTMLLVVIGPCYCQAIFVTAGIAFSHCMSTWYFVAKYRRKVFDGDAIQRLKVMFEKVCTDFETQLVEINGEAEHVHLLIHYPPKHSVSSMVNSLKGVSSRLLRIERPDIEKRYWNNVLWSPSYLAASCGGAPLAIIKQYVEQQKTPL